MFLSFVYEYSLHDKWFTESDRRRSCGHQPGTKSDRRPAGLRQVVKLLCGSCRIFFVRTSEETSRTVVFDALEGQREGCLLNESTRRPFCPDPPQPAAPPPPRPDPLVLFRGFGFKIFTLLVIPKRYAGRCLRYFGTKP